MIDESIKTGHNPFSRETVSGKKVSAKKGGCDWCGGTPKSGKLTKYSVSRDDNMSGRRGGEIKGEFCGVDCANSYHGN